MQSTSQHQPPITQQDVSGLQVRPSLGDKEDFILYENNLGNIPEQSEI